MQTQADLIGAPVARPRCVETTAMGAAYFAGLAVGFWESMDTLLANGGVDRVFQPSMPEVERQKRLKGWRQAVGQVRMETAL